MSAKETLVLEANLFGDTETLRSAVAQLPSYRTIEINPSVMNPEDWDHVVSGILASEKTIVV